MTSFEKLNSAANELINIGYTHDQPWKLQFQHSDKTMAYSQMAMPLSSGVISATASMKRMGAWGFIDGNFSGNSVGATLSCKVPQLTGTSLTAKYLQKLDLGSKGDCTADIALDCTLPQLNGNRSKAISLLTPHMAATYSPLKQSWSLATTSGLMYCNSGSLLMGAKANGTMKGHHVDYSVGACLVQVDQGKVLTLAALTHPYEGIPFSKHVGSIHFKNIATSRLAQLGAEMTHYPNKGQSPDFSVAAQLHLGDGDNKNLNDTVLKARINKNAMIALALSHKLSDKLTTTLGFEMKAGSPETIKHGLSFRITP